MNDSFRLRLYFTYIYFIELFFNLWCFMLNQCWLISVCFVSLVYSWMAIKRNSSLEKNSVFLWLKILFEAVFSRLICKINGFICQNVGCFLEGYPYRQMSVTVLVHLCYLQLREQYRFSKSPHLTGIICEPLCTQCWRFTAIYRRQCLVLCSWLSSSDIYTDWQVSWECIRMFCVIMGLL